MSSIVSSSSSGMSRASEQGVWDHIISHTPGPEREELSSLVGRALIAANQSLWAEKAMLQDIYYELHGGRKASGLKDALKFGQSHYSGLAYATGTQETFERQLFSIDHCASVRRALEDENGLLEARLAALQLTLDQAADDEMSAYLLQAEAKTVVKSKPSTAADTAGRKAGRGSKPFPSANPAVPSAGSAIPSATSRTSPSRRQDQQQAAVSSSGDPLSPTSHDDDRPPSSGSASKGSSSRFRTRLLDARSELFLTDDLV